MAEQYTFLKRTNTQYGNLKNLIYYKNGNPFELNPKTGGNCTWYAWGRFWEVWASVDTKYQKSMPKTVSSGDAVQFYSDGKANGFSVGKKPKPGAIVCWGYNGSSVGHPGHVAFVEAVNMNADGTVKNIEISQSGWSSGPLANKTIAPDSKGRYKFGYNNDYFNGFIYNPIDFGNPAGAMPDSGGLGGIDQEINAITDLPYGGQIVAAMQSKLGEKGTDSNGGNWGVTLLYNVFKECSLDKDCFNLPTLGKRAHWTYWDAYDWLMSNGTFIYDYTDEKVKEYYLKLSDPDKKTGEVDVGGVGTNIYSVNDINDFRLAEAGDIVFLSHGNNDYTSFDGIGVVVEAPSSSSRSIKIVAEYLGQVVTTSRKMATVHTIIRPPYGVIEGGIRTPEYADILAGSQNYEAAFAESDDSVLNRTTDTLRQQLESSPDFTLSDSENIINLISSASRGQTDRNAQTVFEGNFAVSSKLPTALSPVEAPYVKVNIGGVEFGTYTNTKSYPNYVSGLIVRKTNNSLNEYTLSLIHQVSPGENPNYIDELLSKNGYEEIEISYGDAEGGVNFDSNKALIIGVNTSFNFVECNIIYTIKATSSAAMSATYKTNFGAVYDKPSNIIRSLLSTDASLRSSFPIMANQTYVDSKNLIPNTDIEVNIPAYNNITPIGYVRELTDYMQNNLSKTEDGLSNSVYVFSINDNSNSPYFQITEINTSDNINNMSVAYQVDVGYPDDAQVFDFKVNTTYGWAMAYKYSGGISQYHYGVDDLGQITRKNGSETLAPAWWTKVTEMPIGATLTTRGLLTPMPLMTYIKVNCAYYGSERISSGVYIVVGQTDELTKNGFRTKLDLMRVAGANQYLNVDGRVET